MADDEASKREASNRKAAGTIRLTDEQRLSWLRLIRSENVGPATFRDLINHFRTASAALEALPELIARGGAAGKIRIASVADAERELAAANKAGGRFVGMGEPGYPPALRAVDYPPPLLCVRGDVSVFDLRAVAIVGSRNASISGMRLAARFASELGQSGFAIVSGLARGIDASAHEHSLTTGAIAVFAGGADHVFPEENRELATRILDHGGVIVSEMPMGWKPRSKDFPRRNRLVAGIAEGLLVVEAARRSGSLISARLANEAGRTVFAVPGSPLDPRCEGANWLIKQGATLVTEAKEIVDDLSAAAPPEPDPTLFEDGIDHEMAPPANADNVRGKITRALSPTPVEIDDIIRFSGATPGQVHLVLIELSLAGRLERHGGNRVSLIG